LIYETFLRPPFPLDTDVSNADMLLPLPALAFAPGVGHVSRINSVSLCLTQKWPEVQKCTSDSLSFDDSSPLAHLRKFSMNASFPFVVPH
jgi:hypothetical protein